MAVRIQTRCIFKIHGNRLARLAILFGITILFFISMAGAAMAQPGRPDASIFGQPTGIERTNVSIIERDYMSQRKRDFHGASAVVGQTYAITVTDNRANNTVTFVMGKDSDLYLQVEPFIQIKTQHFAQPPRPDQATVSIVMLVSEPSAPRILKPVWSDNRFRYPIRFWTSHFWTPIESCGPLGQCSKIQFMVTNGNAHITVLDKKQLRMK